jgi:hypothetical protein
MRQSLGGSAASSTEFVSTLVSSLACPPASSSLAQVHADNAGTGLLCALASRPAAPRQAKRKKECSKVPWTGDVWTSDRRGRDVTGGSRPCSIAPLLCSCASALQSSRMQPCVFLAQNACISLGWPEPRRILSRLKRSRTSSRSNRGTDTSMGCVLDRFTHTTAWHGRPTTQQSSSLLGRL